HVVDPSPPGAGTVWRPEQSRHLLMNTVASQITVFTDDSARLEGPIESGPSLYEWARALEARAGAGVPGAEDIDADVLAEARGLGPD
ncbi:FAD/NAD(P)-binding protein, partial [Streptomyces sp. SID8455]|nr:FAD/NAD(P)-binding protein [Streptomyces sp. SID8455]